MLDSLSVCGLQNDCSSLKLSYDDGGKYQQTHDHLQECPFETSNKPEHIMSTPSLSAALPTTVICCTHSTMHCHTSMLAHAQYWQAWSWLVLPLESYSFHPMVLNYSVLILAFLQLWHLLQHKCLTLLFTFAHWAADKRSL